MALIVQKYGGSSVGSPERIRAVAARVAAARRRGDDVVVVVSAMGDTTDELLTLAEAVTGSMRLAAEHPRETDMLLSAGERISMALLAMAIRGEGVEARSLTGSQAAIITDGAHTTARIVEVRGDRVRGTLADGAVAIVAGFQGVSVGHEITTLGRGGSDTTAVALACALGADRCEVYTDVDGVYSCDPRRVPGARIIPVISHVEMLEMASAGAQVMHARAVDMAARFGMDIRVLSSFTEPGAPEAGTLITLEPTPMEDLVLTGIASMRGFAKLVVRGLPAGMDTPTEMLSALADAGVSVDMVVEAPEADGRVLLQLTLRGDEVARARAVVERVGAALGGSAGTTERAGLSRITLVGSGMHGRPGVFAEAFGALAAAEIETLGVSTSAVSITVLVASDDEPAALRMLHAAFQLHAVSAREAVSETPATRA
jgi:aspartate kinase